MRRISLRVAAVAVSLAAVIGCGGGDGDSGGSVEAFCSLDDNIDVENLTDIDEFDSALDQAVDAAPDEVKGDMETVRGALTELTSGVRDLGVEDISDLTPEQTQAAIADIQSAEFAQASRDVSAYIKANCDTAN